MTNRSSKTSRRLTVADKPMHEQPEHIPLPAVKPKGGALALPEFSQLEADLKDVLTLLRSRKSRSKNPMTAAMERSSQTMAMLKGEDPDKEVARLRRTLSRSWEAADQPASTDQIAGEVALLAAAFPNTSRAELKPFIQMLLADVAALKPTLYELSRATRAVRTKYEFLSIAVVVKEIKAAKRASHEAHWLATGSFRTGMEGPAGGISERNYFMMINLLAPHAEDDGEDADETEIDSADDR
jgi:hypothetical protein